MMKHKRILAMILAVASCLSLAVGASAANTTARKATDFKDYDRTAWYAEAVVDDLCIRSGRNGTIRTNGNREDGRHDYGHLVAAGSPPMLPSAVDESVTLEVPVPPEVSTVLAAEAEIARDAIMQMARMREMVFLKFFMVKSP